MPRKTRDITIKIDEESIKDAMALWVKTYHGVEIDAKKIEINTEGEVSAEVVATAKEKRSASSTDHSGT